LKNGPEEHEEDIGQGTIRHVIRGQQSSENSGSVPKTSDRGVFEPERRDRSDSIVKVSSQEAKELQYNLRPTGGSDKPTYEQATLFNLASSSNKSQALESRKSQQELTSKNSEQGIDEISRLINEQYQMETENKDINFIFKDERLFDQPKKAVYGIQPAPNTNAF
jgi:hypothetical protein